MVPKSTANGLTWEAQRSFTSMGRILLAPTGALVLMMVYYISAAAAATFSDFEHLCLSILLQVSL